MQILESLNRFQKDLFFLAFCSKGVPNREVNIGSVVSTPGHFVLTHPKATRCKHTDEKECDKGAPPDLLHVQRSAHETAKMRPN